MEEEKRRIFKDILRRNGKENPYRLKHELREIMGRHMGIFRSGDDISEGLKKIKALKDRFQDISIEDKGRVYNTNLINALELENMLLLAETATLSALAREESRGAHARLDFPKRDDGRFHKHTLVTISEDGPKLDYKDVVTKKWIPAERKY